MSIVGTVSEISRDSTGIKVEGKWYNYSKFLEFPQKHKPGNKVRLVLDGKWIKEFQSLKESTLKSNQEKELRITKPTDIQT